jgi:ABC-type multidrug transport system fused ATPase/permease subunit
VDLNIWEFLVWLFWFYVIVACIWLFITVLVDIFRDRELNGWVKALWVIFLVALPFLAAFIYIIARGDGMTRRSAAVMRRQQEENAEYIRTVAGGSAGSSATAEIEAAKRLLDSGAITTGEYDAIKTRALATV